MDAQATATSGPAAGQAFKIDTSRGERIGTVSAQWASRPPEERFTSLGELHAQVKAWREQSHTESCQSDKISVTAKGPSTLVLAADGKPIDEHTNWSVKQIAAFVGAPGDYITSLPAPLAAVNLQYGLKATEAKERSLYIREDAGKRILRAMSSPKYGRIFDQDVAEAVMKIAGNGTGDQRWKVPGLIDWGAMKHNPNVDVTKETTTLYASDRDVFMFLCDDRNPIEIGKLSDGSPDMVFRGFYVWNSEVGSRTFGVATMYLRGVCQNRNLWGCEGFSEVTFKHTSGAPERFVTDVAPALTTYANASTNKLLEGVNAAKSRIIAKGDGEDADEDRVTFLMRFGFSEKQAQKLIGVAVVEEGKKPESVWDFAQAVTAQARKAEFQEDRLKLENVGGKMLDKVTG